MRAAADEANLVCFVLAEDHWTETRVRAFVIMQVVGGRATLLDLDCMGYRKAIFKTDREAVVKAAQGRVTGAWFGEGLLQYSAAASPASNGPIENAHPEREGHVRALKLALEKRIKVDVTTIRDVVFWFVGWAAERFNVFKIWHDWNSAFERKMGKPDVLRVCELRDLAIHMPQEKRER